MGGVARAVILGISKNFRRGFTSVELFDIMKNVVARALSPLLERGIFMGSYYEMAVTGRHRFLTSKLFNNFSNLLPKSYVNKGDLDVVQPDLVIFHKQPYIENYNETKTAGFPDLVVEVWSEGNSKQERDEKFNLY